MTGRSRSFPEWLESPVGLASLFALGLLLRLAVARHSAGLWFDVTLFRQWSDRLVTLGPSRFYAPDYVVDYPPGYLYVLLALGKASRVVLGEPPSIAVLKLPAIFADLGVAALAALLAARFVSPDGKSRLPLRAAASSAILFNPALILDSAVWGQVDSVFALLVLAGVFALAGSGAGGGESDGGRPGPLRESGGVVLLAIALATKPQAVLALPVLGVVVLRRHLSGRFTSRAWTATLLRILLYGLIAVGVVVAMFAPFGIGPGGIPAFYHKAGSMYPVTSLWAFNVWGISGFFRPDAGADAVTIGGLPAFLFSVLLFSLCTLALAIRSWRSLDRAIDPGAVALFGAIAVTCAGFTLLTRMHERYLFLAVAGLAPFVADRRMRWSYLVLSTCLFLNLHLVYVYFAEHSSPPTAVWTVQPLFNALFGLTQDAWQQKAWSAITALSCLAVASLGWGWLDAGDRFRHDR